MINEVICLNMLPPFLCSCIIGVAKQYIHKGVNVTEQVLQSKLARLASKVKELEQTTEQVRRLGEQKAGLEGQLSTLEHRITERTAVADSLADSGKDFLRRLVGIWLWAYIHLKDRGLAPDSRELGFTWERDTSAAGGVCYRVRALDACRFPGCSEIEFTEVEWTSVRSDYMRARDPANWPALPAPAEGLPVPLLGQLAAEYRSLEEGIADKQSELQSLVQAVGQAQDNEQRANARAAAMDARANLQQQNLDAEARRNLLNAQSMSLVLGNQAMQLAVQLPGGAQLGAPSGARPVWVMPSGAASPWFPLPVFGGLGQGNPAVAGDASTSGQLQRRSLPSEHTAALQSMMRAATWRGKPTQPTQPPTRLDPQRTNTSPRRELFPGGGS